MPSAPDWSARSLRFGALRARGWDFRGLRNGIALERWARMNIRFWGVRGSIASPGRDTAAVGGNTSSIELTCGTERIILDAGTGLRALGNHLVESGATREPLAMTLLLSHYHWDHIQGLPFF